MARQYVYDHSDILDRLKKMMDRPGNSARERSRIIHDLVEEFWFAKKLRKRATERGNKEDSFTASERMKDASLTLKDLGFFNNRASMPTLDELDKG